MNKLICLSFEGIHELQEPHKVVFCICFFFFPWRAFPDPVTYAEKQSICSPLL